MTFLICDNSCVIKHLTICLSPYLMCRARYLPLHPTCWYKSTSQTQTQMFKCRGRSLNVSTGPKCLFTQELCQVIFGRDVLRNSNFTGKRPEGKPPKSQLDQRLVEAVIGKCTESNTPNVLSSSITFRDTRPSGLTTPSSAAG